MKRPIIAYDIVHELFNYDEETGIVTWKITGNPKKRIKIDQEVGSISDTGYRIIEIHNTTYPVHKLIWLYVYGYYPENGILHINKIPDANWLSNLKEEIDTSDIIQPCKNTSGCRGVYWSERDQKWVAQVCDKDNKQIFLGVFKIKIDAVFARWEGEKQYKCRACNCGLSPENYIKTHIDK